MEIRDLYDKDRKLTGKTILKGENIPEGSYIIVMLIFIQNSEGKFLIQKRSKEKNGLLAATGGHAKAGETSIQAIQTEVKEEIGLDLPEDKIELYFSGRQDEERVFFDDYYIKLDIDDISKLNLQKEEVESVCWMTTEEIIEAKKNGTFFMNHFEEFETLIEWLDNKEKGISIKEETNNKEQYMELLLEADPSERMVKKYLNGGELYVLTYKDDVACVAVVEKIDDDIVELKNIVTKEKYRGQGFGKRMINYLSYKYKVNYKKMLVGTTENNIPFYVKLGFDNYEKTIKNFFVDNYEEEIWDEDLKCIDMYCYSKQLNKSEN